MANYISDKTNIVDPRHKIQKTSCENVFVDDDGEVHNKQIN